MDTYEPFLSFALALASGLLIGLEREQSRGDLEQHGTFHGGVRTIPLFSLLGAVSAFLARQWGLWPLLLTGTALVGFIAITYFRDVQRGFPGLTSEGAFILSYLLGVLALSPQPFTSIPQRVFVVASLAITTTVILSSRASLHSLLARTSRDDLYAALKFLIVAIVVLPLLPDAPHGPYGILNPWRIGVLVAMLAGLSFAGYGAIRIAGPARGMLVTGAVGGLVSSTAVTLTAAERARKHPALASVAAQAIVLASAIMFARVWALTYITNAGLVAAVAQPLGAMALTGVAFVVVLHLRTRGSEKGAGVVLSNPFELSAALKMTALLVGVLLVSRWATSRFGEGAAYLTSVLAGTTDVDAITLSMSALARQGLLAPQIASLSIIIAVVSNTAVKGGMTLVVGGWAVGRWVALAFGLQLVVGALAVLIS